MRVLVVDDHQLFLDGIRHILEKLDKEMQITEANSVEKAIQALEHPQELDLALIDLCMPGMDGIALLQSLRERKLRLPVVVVSGEDNAAKIRSALELGALGFIPKSYGSQQMLDALNGVLEGDIYLPDHIEQQINRLSTRRPPLEAEANLALKTSGITRRQYDVLQLMAQGYSNKQIASTLFLTEHTVKSHVSALFVILGASNRTSCVQNAVTRDILAKSV